MKNSKNRIVLYIVYILLGAVLFALGLSETVDEFWSGLGSGLLCVAVLQLFRMLRMNKNEEYRERVETGYTDERNRFIRGKAWAWAGYMFIIIAAVVVIVLKVMGQELLSMAASGAMCLVLVLYWVSYYILSKKY